MNGAELDRLIAEVFQLRADVYFSLARDRLLNVLDALVTGESDVPQFVLPVRSMTRRVHLSASTPLSVVRLAALPFGWTMRKTWHLCAVDVGPWWYLRGREVVDHARHAFYSFMLYKLKRDYPLTASSARGILSCPQ